MGGERTTDQLAAELRQDHVLVDQVLGSGRTAEIDARLTELAAQTTAKTGVEVYVVDVAPPTDVVSKSPAKDLAVTLPRRLGDGVYSIDTGDGTPEVVVRGTSFDPTRTYLAVSEVTDAVSQEIGSDYGGGQLPPTVQAEAVLRVVLAQDPRTMRDGPYGKTDADRYGQLPPAGLAAVRELAAATVEPELRDRSSSTVYDEGREPATTGDLAVWGATSGLVVLAVAFLTLRRSWPGTKGLLGRIRGGGPTATVLDRAAVTEEVETGRTRLAERLASVADRPEDADAFERAVAAREALDVVLPTADDRELVGALTLVRTGLDDAERARRPRGEPWRPCFVNPLHGEGTERATSPLDDTTVEVPVCETCRRRLRRRRAVDPFRPRRVGRDRAYYETDDVWSRTGYGAIDADYAHTVLADRAAAR